MLSSLTKPADTYHRLYHGKTIVVKVGGKELADPKKSHEAVQSIQSLANSGVNMVLVYGGGSQIDEKWNENHPGEPRPKIDGVGHVTPQIMEEAVLPAAADLNFQMLKSLAYTGPLRDKNPVPEFIPPEALVSEIVQSPDGATYTAKLLNIDVDLGARPFGKDSSTLKVIGFVGKDPKAVAAGEYADTNINADEVVAHIADRYHELVDEVIFVTSEGGVKNNNQKVVKLLTAHAIDDILNGTHPTITATDGMKKKLLEIRAMLENVDKVAITSADGILREIENWAGSGTLCVNENKAAFTAATPDELEVFEAVYADLAAKGIFRQRNAAELAILKEHHYILRVKNSPLAGFSLTEASLGWSELAAVWSGYLENGVGTQLMEEMKKLVAASGKKVFALTTSEKAERLFAKAGFTACGKLQEVQITPPFELPSELAEYDTSSRSPSLFIFNP